MKKLSFVLALIIALSTMIGLFATPAYAEDAYDVTYTVGGDGADYATVGAALAACTDASQTYKLKVVGDSSDTFTETNNVVANVTICSDATENVPTVTVAATSAISFITASANKVITFENLNIAVNNKAALITPAAGSSIYLKDSIITCSNSALVCAYNSAVNNSTLTVDGCNITSAQRIIYHNAGATDTNLYTININNSTLSGTANGPIQVSNKAPGNLIINIDNSSLTSTNNVCIYARFAETSLTLKNSTFTCGSGATNKNIIDGTASTQDNSTFDATIVGCKFIGNGGNDIYTTHTDGEINIVATTLSKKIATTSNVNIYSGNYTNATFALTGTASSIYGGTFTVDSISNATVYGGTFNGVETLPTGVTKNNATISLAGAQLLNGTTAESASTSARFVATLTAADLSEYTEVGFYISKVNGSVASEGDYIVKKDTTSVFTSIQAGGTPYVAADGSYIVLAEITDIANADFGDTVYVRAYAKTASGTIVSDVQEFSVTKALAN